MTVAWMAGNQITGLSTDRTGGTWTNLPAGYRFIETDTGFSYLWSGTAWTTLLATTSGDSLPTVFDTYPSTYTLSADHAVSPNALWHMVYRGYNVSNPSDVGTGGVRAPSTLPPNSNPRVWYGMNCTGTNTSTTNAQLTLKEGSYLTDFDMTYYMRTKRQTRSVPNIWETAWLLFRFNEAGFQITQAGANFHHYYLVIQTDGSLEFGRKDNTQGWEEQTFLAAVPNVVTWSLNTWIKVQIRAVGNLIKIWINDVLRVNVLDDGSVGTRTRQGVGSIPVEPPSSFMYSGKFGPYAEDSECEWSQFTITTIGAGGGGAPANTPYITLGVDGSLTGERVLAAGSSKVSLTDGGAGGNLTVDVVEANLALTNMNTTLADSKNIALGTTTGTKIGTATTQKLGFFNVAPVVQPAANPDTSGATLANLETEVNQLKATLRSLGLLA